jgi:hypothetical protein
MAIMCLFASGSLTGCSGTETQTSKTIQIQPKNLQVGQTIQFIANVKLIKLTAPVSTRLWMLPTLTVFSIFGRSRQIWKLKPWGAE